MIRPPPGAGDARLLIRRWWQARCTPDHPLWLPREAAFGVMRQAGLDVIEWSRTPEWPGGHPGPCVAYHNEHEHAGDGKALLQEDQVRALPAGHLISRFVPPGGLSYRLLKIGLKTFGLRYTSPEWRSNGGPEGEIHLTRLPDGRTPALHRQADGWPDVIWAVDFVEDHGHLLAVDLNPAPGVQGTGVLNHLSGFSVLGELERYHEQTGEAFWTRP